jgi:hypothetical protein
MSFTVAEKEEIAAAASASRVIHRIIQVFLISPHSLPSDSWGQFGSHFNYRIFLLFNL